VWRGDTARIASSLVGCPEFRETQHGRFYASESPQLSDSIHMAGRRAHSVERVNRMERIYHLLVVINTRLVARSRIRSAPPRVPTVGYEHAVTVGVDNTTRRRVGDLVCGCYLRGERIPNRTQQVVELKWLAHKPHTCTPVNVAVTRARVRQPRLRLRCVRNVASLATRFALAHRPVPYARHRLD
jgi:hypothetical protein